MSDSQLVRAVESLDERKSSAWGGPGSKVLTGADARAIAIGFDLDLREVVAVSMLASGAAITGIVEGRCDLQQALSGAWYDGLLTGLLLAEIGANEAAREAV